MNVITTEEFNQRTQSSSGKQIIVFSAAWCGPCKMLTPVLDKLSESYGEVGFAKVDIEEQQDLTISLGITGVPTVMFYDNGEMKHRHVGASSQAILKDMIEKYL